MSAAVASELERLGSERRREEHRGERPQGDRGPLLRLGRGEEAIAALKKAVHLMPALPDAWRALGDHYTALELREAADWVESYRTFWEKSFDRLDEYLKQLKADEEGKREKG